METFLKDCLMIGLKSKGFNLDFEAKANINGGFECYIFTEGNHVAIVTGRRMRSKSKGVGPQMAYKTYFCPLGDDEYLRHVLESENIGKDSRMMNGIHRGLFKSLHEKVKSYGSSHSALKTPHPHHVAQDTVFSINNHSKQNVIPLFDSSRLKSKKGPLITAVQ